MSYIQDFEKLVQEQLKRVERMKNEPPAIDYSGLDKIIIGFVDGDGIGPVIMKQTRRVLDEILREDVAEGRVEMRTVEGLTLENRVARKETLPAEVLEQIRQCNVFLKGPTTTPNETMNMPNLESANVALRRELDLFANVRPISIPERGIDWTFFRENTEGEYIVGSHGVAVSDDMCVDFKITTTQGTERIARMAFEYARANGKNRVECVTKANIMKKTDGKFLEVVHKVGEEYPDIRVEDWYIDIMTANLINEEMQKDFQVSSCRICTAISSPMRQPRFRAASAQPAAPTSETAMPCLRRFTAALRVWWKRESRTEQIRRV